MGQCDYGSMQGRFDGIPKYSVECAVGCIAVVESEIFYNNGRNGLHSDDEGVVWFKMGKRCNHECKHCGRGFGIEWRVPQATIDEAVKEADKLNEFKTD